MKNGTWRDVPGQVQVWFAVEVQLVLEHLVDGVARRAILRDLVFGNVPLTSVRSGERGEVSSLASAVAAGRLLLGHTEVLEVADDVLGVDLRLG